MNAREIPTTPLFSIAMTSAPLVVIALIVKIILMKSKINLISKMHLFRE